MSSASARPPKTKKCPATPPNLVVVNRFLSWILTEHGCFEIRAIKSRISYETKAIVRAGRYSTLSGFYDNTHDACVDIQRVEGTSLYVTINPVDRALMGRLGSNEIRESESATSDENINVELKVLIDIDSVRPADISATNEQVADVMARLAYLLEHEPAIAAASHWGCSGNGGWCIAEIAPVSPTEGLPLVDRFLKHLSDIYSTETVNIDSKTRNASRIGPIPGTFKCKGSSIADRPWRMITMESPDRPLVPLDLAAYVTALPPLEQPELPRKPPKGLNGHVAILQPHPGQHAADLNGQPVRPDVEDRIKRATAYLAAMPPAVEGKNGHGHTFDAACAVVKGFDLSPGDAFGPLACWNQGCQPPWDDADLWHKLHDADKKPDTRIRGYLYDADHRPDQGQFEGGFEAEGEADPEANGQRPKRSNEGPADPHRLARIYIDQKCRHKDGITIRFHNGLFTKWNGSHYQDITDKQINSELTKIAKAEFDRINEISFREWVARGKKDERDKPCKAPETHKVGTHLVGDMHLALTSYSLLDGQIKTPSWLKDSLTPHLLATEILPCRNALIHLPSLINGGDYMVPPTPLFFASYSLDYDFDSVAPEPTEWLKFLRSIWDDDQQSIDTLQDWFGYCLTSDMRQQKILSLIGPKRAGKDTIARTLTAMIGEDNVAGPTLSGLATNFGLAPLIGKPLAIISDARLSGRIDAAIIVERLLAISGEGTLTIDRKHATAWTGKLPTRIVIISNELPRFSDSSCALASRLILLRLTRSFYGNEDLGLFSRLLKEMPGILNWSIQGWKRLRDRGFFVQPHSGQEMIEEMEDLGSPLGMFIRERVLMVPDNEIEVRKLYRHWRMWCEEVGRRDAGDIQRFGRDMRALYPDLKVRQPRKPKTDKESRERVYVGFCMNPDYDYDLSEAPKTSVPKDPSSPF